MKLTAAASVCALLSGGYVFAPVEFAPFAIGRLAQHGNGAMSLRLDPISGRAELRDGRLQLADGVTLHVGEIHFATGYGLITAAHAAENVALKNVLIETPDYTLRAPAIEIAGSSLTQKDFAALMDGTSSKPLPEMLAGFAASSIAMPEAIVERKLSGSRQIYTLRKVALRDIANGKAASVAAEDGIITGPSPSEGKFGAVGGKALDLAQFVRVFAAAPATPDREPLALAQALTIDKVDVRSKDGGASFGKLTLTEPRIQLGASPARFLPLLGTFTASDITFDTVRAKAPNEKLHWTAKNFVLSADAPRDTAPTKFAIKLDGLTVAIPANSNDPSFKNLTELGYTAIVLSLAGDANWNPQTREFEIKQLGLSAADVGSVTFNATLGKVTKDVFSGDKTVSQAAMKDATAKSLNVIVENRGLYEHVVMREAKKRGKSLDDTRKELSLASTLTFTTMTSGTPAANVIAAAIGKFVAKPGKLTVSVKSKDPAGIPIASLSDASARKALNDKIDITATAD